MNLDVVVDAGNSRLKWGRCSGGAVVEVVALRPDDPKEWSFQLARWQLQKKCQWTVAGSDPARRDQMAQWLGKQDQKVLVLSSFSQLAIAVSVREPEKVGLDRLLSAVAVNSRKPKGVAAVIIDAGTAVTVDYVDAAGVFQGGAILPGLRMMADCLHEQTAALPRLESAALKQLPQAPFLPGKSTVEAMVAGITACLAGGVERIAQGYVDKAGAKAVFYFGGGDGPQLQAQLNFAGAHLWPEMTLEGIRIAAEQLS